MKTLLAILFLIPCLSWSQEINKEIPPSCYITEWWSGDNLEEWVNHLKVKDSKEHYLSIYKNIGQYLPKDFDMDTNLILFENREIDPPFIISSKIAKELSQCEKEYTEDKEYYDTNISIKNISDKNLKDCSHYAPNLKNCLDVKYVLINESDGSISKFDENIYGLFEYNQKKYILLLVNGVKDDDFI